MNLQLDDATLMNGLNHKTFSAGQSSFRPENRWFSVQPNLIHWMSVETKGKSEGLWINIEKID